MFVGRVHELGVLAQALAEAERGAGGVALVAGEPGIGKTRLLEELAGRHAGPVAWGGCVDGGGVPPFWPWVQVLRRCADPRVRGGGGTMGVDVALLLEAPPDHDGETGVSRFRLFEGVVQVLEVVSSRSPLMVVLDDLQWADEASVRLLQFVAGEARRLPVLVAGAYRDTDTGPGHPMAEALDDLVRHGPLVTLGGLDPPEVATLISGLVGIPASADEPGHHAATVHRQTGGNPFFAVELARLQHAEGRVGAAHPGRPSASAGVRAVVARRLARLPHTTQDVLQWAAVVGSAFDLTLVAAAGGRPPSEVLAALGPAVSARMVAVDGDGRFRFVHDLVREVLIGSLGEAERASRRWAIGSALTDTAGDDPQRVAQVASHLIAGAAAGDVDAAVCWAVRAAERASAVLAYEDAAAWYRRALATRRMVVAGDATEAELLLTAGRALVEAGDRPAARLANVSAALLARSRGDARQLAEAALGLGAGPAGFEVSLFDQQQIDLLQEALAALPSEDSSLRAIVEARLSVALAFVEGSHRRVELSENAIAMARRLGDGQALAYALAAWCDACSGPDEVTGRLRASEEVITLAMANGQRPLELLGRRLRVVALLEQGRLLDVDTEVDAFARSAEVLRQPLYRWYVPLWRSTLAMAAGDFVEAARQTDQAESIGRQAHSENAHTLVAVQRFVRLRYERRFADVLDVVAPLLVDEPDISGPEALEGSFVVLDLVRGDLDRARRRADRLAEAGLHAPRADSEWLVNLGQLAEVASTLRHEPLATAVHDALEPYGDVFMVEGIGAAVYGATWHYLAVTAEVAGWRSTARRYAALAEERNRSAGVFVTPPPLRAQPGSRPLVPVGGGVEAELRAEGSVWAMSYGGTTIRVRDSKGLRDLAILLRSPGTPRHVTELTGAPMATTAPDLDRSALAAYRRRLADLEEDQAEAEANSDTLRSSQLRHERDLLVEQLAAAVGLGHRSRRHGDPVERARKAVTARIRDTIRIVGAAHPQLGQHLANSVRTGTWCSYQPEQPIRWKG